MKISGKTAQGIIDELSSVLQQQLNFFNESGVILASTNHERIGQFHGGAAKLIAEHLDELTIYRDEEYPGARKGCNFPLTIDSVTVGAIGITGEYQEVCRYGQIIKKMTELMIRENDVLERKKIEDRIRDRFLDDWILSAQDETDSMFVRRANAQRIDLNLPRRVALLRIRNLKQYADTPDGQQMIDRINRHVRQYMAGLSGGIFSKTPSLMILLLPAMPDRDMRSLLMRLLADVEERFGVFLIAGADSFDDVGKLSIHHAYVKAFDALNACSLSEEKRVFFYDETTYELFLSELSERSRLRFIQRVFGGLSEEEVEEYAALLTTLYENDGSIARTAQAHFIHKNTLQYKLNRLMDKTGYNPRSCSSIPLYYLAVLFYKHRP